MPAATATSNPRRMLLRVIDEAYNKTAWHGPNLRGAVRRVTPQQAVWRARPARRNIAEIVLHCAYWKYAVRRRVRGDKRGSFHLKGSNWFEVPRRLGAAQWREYLTLLDNEHAALRDAITNASPAELAGRDGREPDARMHGVAFHDIYHAGQIQLIKALYKQATG